VLNTGAIHLLRSFRAVDRQAGLSPARLSALSVLVFGGPCTLGALAAAEVVAGPTMTRIVDGLIDEGLAERRPHPGDRRAVSVAATPAGQELMLAAQRRRIDALAEALAGLSAADQRRIAASAALLDDVAAVVRAQLTRRPAGGAGAGVSMAAPEESADGRVHRLTERQARRQAARDRWAQAADQLTTAARRAEARSRM
jgi:DNA-binding MarR family transcriptional regulator